MFCNKCGKEIAGQARFCPICGQECAPKKEDFVFQSYVDTANQNPKKENLKISLEDRKRLLQIAGIAAAIILVLVLVVVCIHHFVSGKSAEEASENFTIVGEWKSVTLMDMGEIFETALVSEAGLSEGIAETVVELSGIDNMEEIALTFTEGGNIYISSHGVGVGLGSMTYELLGDKVCLQYSLDASAFGFNMPINISYTGKYKVDKDGMSLELFGYEMKFVRPSEENDF